MDGGVAVVAVLRTGSGEVVAVAVDVVVGGGGVAVLPDRVESTPS